MKKILLYLLLLFCGIATAQDVSVPDNNFLAQLLTADISNTIAKDLSGNPMAIDADGNNIISQAEAALVGELNVKDTEIGSLAGIEYFINLSNLNCSLNNLTQLDVTMLADLEALDCSNNSLTLLEVHGLQNLEELRCFGNDLTAINFTGLEDLRFLNCWANNFTTLDVTPLTDLRDLDCSGNQITTLTVAGLDHLEILNCAENYISVLDLTGLDSLRTLDCALNAILSLDVWDCEYLENLYCADNQLTTLDLNNNFNLTSLTCFNNNLITLFIKNGQDEDILESLWIGNDYLEYICADESQISSILTDDGGMPPSIQLNSYCSYEPGGIYNKISGLVKFDYNNNSSCDDTEDYVLPSLRLQIIGDGYEDDVFTKADGSFTFYVGSGEYTITPVFENDYFVATPDVATHTFTVIDGTVEQQDFCVQPSAQAYTDVEVVIAPETRAMPGFNARYKMVYKNKGNQVVPAGNVTCYWDSSRLQYVDMYPMADGIGSNTYTWNYTNLKPFETREIDMELNVNSPTDTPPVNIDDVLTFGMSIDPGVDELPEDNTFEFKQVVVGSMDPNNIVCIEGETVAPTTIGDYLHYIVNFENIGTAEANFVVLEMDVNPDEFDINSLMLINSSHTVTTRVQDNRITFRMENANLGAADHGNILFKQKTKNSLMMGDMVANKVNIYFDYNFPIVTNDATTTFAETAGAGGFKLDNSVKVYPNPAKNIVRIETDNSINSIHLYDIQGRLLQTQLVNDISSTIDVTNRAAGIYIMKIITENGAKVEKLIRE